MVTRKPLAKSPASTRSRRRPARQLGGKNRGQNGHRRLGLTSDKVYQALREQIVSGQLPPGTRLSHRSIATAMGTSNGPVVGALRRLAHDGLIDYEPSAGGMTKQFTEEELADAMVLRRALETEAARLVSRRAAPEDIDRLYSIVHRMGALVRREAWREADEADVELHIAIARLTRSVGLMEALDRCHLRDLVRRRILVRDRQRDIQCLEQNHRRLVDAIASHDPELAGRTMHEHLSRKKS